MRILVLFTGGTIGSSVNEGYISPDSRNSGKLIDMYNNTRNNAGIIFEAANPFTLLSENSSGKSIAMLISEVSRYLTAGYDGIIVTHGTDTIQYSAAALSYSFPDIKIPLLLVSANHVLDDPESNGLSNFSAAVSFIENNYGNGVFVPYENNEGSKKIVYVHKGTRLLPHLPYSDNLFSIKNRYYGYYDDNKSFIKTEPDNIRDSHISLSLSAPGGWGAEVLRIFPYPGMEYPSLHSFPILPKAILLDTYHSGTLCTGTPGMKQFFDEAKQLNIEVYLSGADCGPDYDSVKLWEAYNITILKPASPIAMYIKLWMSVNEKNTTKIMRTPISDDFLL